MPLFNVIFNGQIAPHTTLEQAKQSLAQLYQVDTARIDNLFNGQAHVLKENLSNEQANQYLELLQQAGIIAQKQTIASALALDLVLPSYTDPSTPDQAPQPQAAPNPYATPKTISHDTESGEYCELKYFSINGRIGRMRLLAWNFGFNFIVALVFITLVGISSLNNPDANPSTTITLSNVLYIVMSIAQAFFVIKRLHDMNRSGWLCLLALIPIVNIFFILYVLCAAGSPNDNDYGAPPPPNTTGVKTLFFIFITTIILGILAAIILPVLLMKY